MATFENPSQRYDPPKSVIGRIKRRLRKRRSLQRFSELQERGFYASDRRSDCDAIFIGGCGRSGTTLVQEIVNRHPRIACGPETSMFGLPFNVWNIAPVWELSTDELLEFADTCEHLLDFVEWFYPRFLLGPHRKNRWADKTPNNVRVVSQLLTWFPNGRFVHVIRDGRDVVCSLRHHPRERVFDGRVVPVHSNNPIDRCANRWLADVGAGRSFVGHPRYYEVHYEQLVAEPESELRGLCRFLGEEFDERMLDTNASDGSLEAGRLVNNENAGAPISNQSIGRWARDLSDDEQAVVRNLIGELLVATGYVQNQEWVADPGSERTAR